MKQMILPFLQSNHPWWVARAFEIANASSAPWKKEWFYLFKDDFLTRYGIPDGWDLQIVSIYCWNCEGMGSYSDYGYRIYPKFCWKCNGTGVYREERVILERFWFYGRVYHLPSSYHYSTRTDAPRDIIKGLIKHSSSGFWISTFCALALFLVFDFPRAKQFFAQVICKSGVRIPGVWRAIRTARSIRRGFEAVGRWAFRRKNDVDDIPF